MARPIPMQPIRKIDALETYMIELVKDKEYKGEPVTREDVMYFVASRLAEEANSSLNRRDWADLFLNGIPKLTEEGVNEWLDEFWIDWDEADTDTEKAAYFKELYELMDELILNFFGIHQNETDAPAEDDSEGGIPD